jgi:hypothetical protein
VEVARMNDWEQVLRREFAAEDGSFLLRLRGLVWDDAAFAQLIAAMKQCAADYEGRTAIDRWVAEGFWFTSQFVLEHAGHPSFPRPGGNDGYEQACERLRDLCHWLFVGTRP